MWYDQLVLCSVSKVEDEFFHLRFEGSDSKFFKRYSTRVEFKVRNDEVTLAD